MPNTAVLSTRTNLRNQRRTHIFTGTFSFTRYSWLSIGVHFKSQNDYTTKFESKRSVTNVTRCQLLRFWSFPSVPIEPNIAPCVGCEASFSWGRASVPLATPFNSFARIEGRRRFLFWMIHIWLTQFLWSPSERTNLRRAATCWNGN